MNESIGTHHPAAESVGESWNPQIRDLQETEEAVVYAEIRFRSFGDVELDEGPTARPQNVVVGPVDVPIEVGLPPL